MAVNYGDVLDQLRDGGLIVDGLQVGTAKPVRCKVEGEREKRGWYRLTEWQAPWGDLLIVGSFGVWHGNDNGARKIELPDADRKREISAEQREALRKLQAENRKRADAERRVEAARAARRATKAWAACNATGESDYLARKGVAAHGVRFSPSGALVIPVLDVRGNVHGLQLVRGAKVAAATKRPDKEFWPSGMAKKGHFHLLGGVPSTVLLIAEGYATAATLHEATGLPVAVAFDAGNMAPVAAALHERYKRTRILCCADDDALASCAECKMRFALADHPTNCPSCAQPHRRTNAGVDAATAAALAVDGAWLRPAFADEAARRAMFIERGRKITDFNDLHAAEGLHVVRAQVEARLGELRWPVAPARRINTTEGAGRKLRPLTSSDDALERYALIYGHGGAAFDRAEHRIVSLSDLRDACVHKDVYSGWMQSPRRDIVRVEDVGFDPAESDPAITCNLWSGWPTVPQAGKCEHLLEMLWHMCSGDRDARRLYDWVQRWLAYPIQNPGAKLNTTVVVHGPQGTGKNLFFEAIASIYGQYGDVLDQSAVEDKFNDWASRKLFMIADEVVARAELHQFKNRLKTLISGKRIRINPKGLAAHWESNHLNLVFLSNETMPLVLEEDDRRHCVIWTPPKREKEFYDSVIAEIRDGGIAALHDHLLRYDVRDFNPGTLPPLTEAKNQLVDLGFDSPTRFYYALYEGDVGTLKAQPARTEHVFGAYRIWCHRNGHKPAPSNKFVAALERKHAVRKTRERYYGSDGNPKGILWIGRDSAPDGADKNMWLGNSVDAFAKQFADYEGEAK